MIIRISSELVGFHSACNDIYFSFSENEKWIVFVIFTFYALTLVIPFVWMLLNSVKSDADFTKNIWGLPEVFEGKNFIEILQYKVITVSGNEETVLEMVGWSILTTVCGTFINVSFLQLVLM